MLRKALPDDDVRVNAKIKVNKTVKRKLSATTVFSSLGQDRLSTRTSSQLSSTNKSAINPSWDPLDDLTLPRRVVKRKREREASQDHSTLTLRTFIETKRTGTAQEEGPLVQGHARCVLCCEVYDIGKNHPAACITHNGANLYQWLLMRSLLTQFRRSERY